MYNKKGRTLGMLFPYARIQVKKVFIQNEIWYSLLVSPNLHSKPQWSHSSPFFYPMSPSNKKPGRADVYLHQGTLMTNQPIVPFYNYM